MIFRETAVPGAFVVELEERIDERGSFARAFCEREFEQHGLPTHFPQSNLSRNRAAGTLRGMHYNLARFAEAKLVRVSRGAIYDLIVDLRPGSPTRKQSVGVELSADNGRALFIPAGFAHGFLTLQDESDVFYQMGELYRPDAARGFRWNDPQFDLRWPRLPSVIAERDATYPDFQEGSLDD